MPGGDGTGPMGMGPMTGRAAGFCAGNSEPGFASAGFGRALRGGRGRGAGWRHAFHATGLNRWQRERLNTPPAAAAPEIRSATPDALDALSQQVVRLQSAIEGMRHRIETLEGTDR